MNREIAFKWLKQALHDLEMAERNIGIGSYDIATFLAHQTVEKLLKTIFALEGKAILKIHYHVRLQDLLLTVKRCGRRNYIAMFKIINHNKRHISKPKELVKMVKTGKIKSGDWFIYDGVLKSA